MIAAHTASVDPDPTVPVAVQLPVGANVFSFSMERGLGSVSMLTDDTVTTMEERTLYFATDEQLDVSYPAHSLVGVDISTLTYLGTSRGFHCWIS